MDGTTKIVVTSVRILTMVKNVDPCVIVIKRSVILWLVVTLVLPLLVVYDFQSWRTVDRESKYHKVIFKLI